MSTTAQIADAWLRRFQSLKDSDLKLGYARHELARLTPLSLLELVGGLMAGSQAGSPEHRELFQVVFVALSAPEFVSLRQEAAEIAEARGDREAYELFASSEASRTSPKATTGLRAPAHHDRTLTLGERKSLARGRDRDVLTAALRDPDPRVVEIVLGNPAATEDDIVRLGATRPIDSEVLRVVYRNRRWSVRRRVQLALVHNPSCPIDIAVQIANQLRRPDARAVAAAPGLPDEVRRAAERILRRPTIH